MKLLLFYFVLGITTRGAFTQSDSCVGRCNDSLDPSQSCQCNTACSNHNDCCDDYLEVCQDDALSCSNKCGSSYEPSLPCQCNTECPQHNNCCPDFDQECGGGGGDGTCAGKCGSGYNPSLQCQCNTECPQHSNCCPDYDQECGGGGGGSLSDADLLELSEMLIRSLFNYCLFVCITKQDEDPSESRSVAL